jgi:hypothetical protein
VDPAINTLCLLATVVCLAPLAVYLFRRGADPFHPFLYMGCLTFSLIFFKTFFTQEQLLRRLSSEDILLFGGITGLSLLAYYAGWAIARSRRRSPPPTPAQPPSWRYDAGRLFDCGISLSVVGLVMYVLTYKQYTLTGYLLDLPHLWIIGAVMILQALVLRPRHLLAGLGGISLALVHPIHSFFSYGQRGDVIRLAFVAMVPFLAAGKRPSRPLVLITGALLALVLSALALTRPLVNGDQGGNRIDALLEKGPAFFLENDGKLTGGEEWYFGAAAVKTARMSGQFGWGRVFLVALPLRFLPKEWFLWKYDYYYNHISFNRMEVAAYTGVKVPPGAAPTGFAEGFVEFWWFFPLFWGLLGYGHQRLFARTRQRSDLLSHAIFVATGISLSYLMTQEILFAVMNLLYTALPALVAYRFCRVPAGAESGSLEPSASAVAAPGAPGSA